MSNKILLAAIAAGLWANAAASFMRPARAQDGAVASGNEVGGISRRLDDIVIRVESIESGMVRLLVETMKRTKCSAD